MRTSLRFWMAGLLAAACGSRTGLLAGFAGTDGGAEDAPSMHDAGDGGTLDASGPTDAADAADARADTAEASPCGAPWVLFSLLTDGEGGAGQSTHIYARRADGTGGHALALPSLQAENPSVSPDGTSLLYTDQTLSVLSLYRFADGSNTVLGTEGEVGFGSLSPDGRLVVFGDGQNLYLVGVDGGKNQTTLVSEVQPNAAGSPVFTPDSGSVVYAVSHVVRSIRLSDYVWHDLIDEPDMGTLGAFPDPTFSPDYASIAAIVQCTRTPELRVFPVASLPAHCTTGRVVTSVSDQSGSPAWGPTGLIAYADGRDVLLVSEAGGASTNLTSDLTTKTAPASGPTWAPACTTLP